MDFFFKVPPLTFALNKLNAEMRDNFTLIAYSHIINQKVDYRRQTMVTINELFLKLEYYKYLFLLSGVFCFFVAVILAFYTRTMYDTGQETYSKPTRGSFLASYLAIGLGLSLIAVGLLGFFV